MKSWPSALCWISPWERDPCLTSHAEQLTHYQGLRMFGDFDAHIVIGFVIVFPVFFVI